MTSRSEARRRVQIAIRALQAYEEMLRDGEASAVIIKRLKNALLLMKAERVHRGLAADAETSENGVAFMTCLECRWSGNHMYVADEDHFVCPMCGETNG